MKIIHLISRESIRTGGSRQLERLTLELAERGHDVTVVFADNPAFRDDFKTLMNSKVDVRFIKMDGFRLSARTFKSILEIRELLKTLMPDVVHVHKGTMLNLISFAGMGLDIVVVGNRGDDCATGTSEFL